MEYSAFVRDQQDTLIREFLTDQACCWVGVKSLEHFVRPNPLPHGAWRTLGETIPPAEAVICKRPSGNDELWVRPKDKGASAGDAYRTYWNSFLREQAVVGIADTIRGRMQHIDHLLPETFAARNGYAYVRVMAVDARSNQTVGSTVEKSMANRVNPGGSFLADWFTVAKASCFHGSFAASVDENVVMEALLKHLGTRGFTVPPELRKRWLESMKTILEWSRAG